MSTPDVFKKRSLVISAWALMLLVSDLPDIFCVQFFKHVPKWLFWGKVGLLLLFLGLSLLCKALRPLQQFAAFLAVFFLALAASAWIGNLPGWQRRFSGPGVSFTVGYVGAYIRDLAVAGAVITVLWIMKRKRKKFFLVKGQMDAPIQPVRWLGIGAGQSWKTFGWIFLIVASLGVAVPTLLGLKLSGPILMRAVSLLPAVLLFAAVNAFTEEVYFRASFLIHPARGRRPRPHPADQRGLLRAGPLPLRLTARSGRVPDDRLSGLAAGQGDAGDKGIRLAVADPFRARRGRVRLLRHPLGPEIAIPSSLEIEKTPLKYQQG